MTEFPGILGFPKRKCQKMMTEQFLWPSRPLVISQIFGTRNEQVSIRQQSYGNERGVMQLFIDAKSEINPFDDLIHDAFGDENLNSDVGVSCLESHDDRRQHGIRDARGSGDSQCPRDMRQMVRRDICNRIIDLGAAASMFQNLRTKVRQT